MKLSEYKGTDALEMLGDIIEPAMEIMTNPEVVKHSREGNIGKAASVALKNNNKAVLAIMAALERKTPEEFAQEVNVLTLPKKLIAALNDPEIQTLFTSSGQTED